MITECGLVGLPEEIRSLRNLTHLYAGDNELAATVPLWLEELPLQLLGLDSNKLEEFPFLHLPGLENLWLAGNQLARLPCVVRDYPLNE